ncbi:MAG: hypothetical protein R3C03_18865 [Pirellulaceae bacterium]
MIEFDFRRPTRRCSQTEKEIGPGDEFFSALVEEPDGTLSRLDFSVEAWTGPGEHCIGWWKSQVPSLDRGKVFWAPNAVLLAVFEHALEKPDQKELAFVMGLVLVRKRALQWRETITRNEQQWMQLLDPKNKKNYEVLECELSPEQITAIQTELAEKLFTDEQEADESANPMPQIDFTKPNKKRIKRRDRQFCFAFAVIVLSLAPGCGIMSRFRAPSSMAPVVLAPTSSLSQIVMTVNEHSERVKQLKSNVRVSMTGVPAMLRGDLLVERPNRIRLTAGLMGMPGFDLGSNDNVFWIWKQASTPSDPPTLYFANHQEFKQSELYEQFQLQPQWLLDGLGLIQFRPEDQHSGPFPVDAGYIEINSVINDNGKVTYRTVVIEPKSGVIRRQVFYDSQRQLRAYIDSKNHEFIADHGVNLPRQIEIYISSPDGQETKMSVTMGSYTLNSLYGDPDKLWNMPEPPDVPRVDLSRVGANPNASMGQTPHVGSNQSQQPNRQF